MKKFVKFLLGLTAVAAAVGGILYFLKNVLMKDYTTHSRVKKEEIVNFGGLIYPDGTGKMSLIFMVSRYFAYGYPSCGRRC